MESRSTFDPGILLRRPATAPSPADLQATFLRVFHEDEIQHKLRIRQQQRSLQRRQQRKRRKIDSDKIPGDRPKRKPKKKRRGPLEDGGGEEDDDEALSDLERKLDGLVCGDIKRDSAIYAPIVRTCGKARDLRAGIRVHEHIAKTGHGSDSFLGNLLVEMYGNCGSVEAASASFDRIPFKNVFSWNMVIAAYARNGHPREAMASFRRMLLAGARPDKITFLAALEACALMGALDLVREIHARVGELAADRDPVVVNSLISAYAKCRSPIEARAVFERIPSKDDVISWNAAVSTCAIAENSAADLASLLQRMDCEGIKPNKLTFLAAMASARTTAMEEWLVRRIRHAVLEVDTAVATGLIRLYGRLGRADDAREYFEGTALRDRDVVAWTAMVAAYARSGRASDAFEIFRRMELEGVSPNEITMLALMEACSCLGSLAIARAIYSRIEREQQDLDPDVENGSIGMFGRCGSVEAARIIFDRMEHRRNLVSYTAMIAAFAQNGCFDEAEELFQSMLLHGFAPDTVSFTCFLSAAVHPGLLHRGWRHFMSMSGDFGIRPSFEHYCCMVNLLARQSKLVDAEDLIVNMPYEPDDKALLSLLGS